MSDDQHYTPTPEFDKQRKGRNLAIGIALAAFVILVFIVTIVRMGGSVFERAL